LDSDSTLALEHFKLNQSAYNLILSDFRIPIMDGIEYPPIQAATIASLIASYLAYLAINLIVRRIHVFSTKKKMFSSR
jgi:hypothetical protein